MAIDFTRSRGSKTLLLFSLLAHASLKSNAQQPAHPCLFPAADVSLLDGPFQHARDLNIHVLLQYDVDRLLAPYRKEAGLSSPAKGFANWEGLDGHIGGHYLSALAMNAAATGNTACKTRMNYMLDVLQACQDANTKNQPDWAKGYVGGVPNSAVIWKALQKGDLKPYAAAWVPWYNVHKMYAGLRDAWLYTGNTKAKDLFLKFCDWAIAITAGLNDAQMQSMLDVEHGGMNEILADAYQLSGDEKYMAAAKRFSHRQLLDPMSVGTDNLDNKHANTQVPKAIGFQRIAELSGDERYAKAASFFWETVTNNRSLAFGGNSRREFFPAVSASNDFINDVEGPESCNSYNMLKLTSGLFSVHPSAKYIDFYERALYNHILSTQHPVHGGYVYFTPARPRHYRVYSVPNQAMWCCVGSGMENHGKYNELIYTHNNDSLFVNLFIASELNWKTKGIRIRQQTAFPYEEQTRLIITKGGSRFPMMIRYPGWVAPGALKLLLNGKPMAFKGTPGNYITVERNWKSGDELRVVLPMRTTIEHLPNQPAYTAFMHGPILLGARAGTEDLKGLLADAGRWSHIPSGERLPVDKSPVLVEDNISAAVAKLAPVKGKPLSFSLTSLHTINRGPAVLEPFFGIHDARYMIYWMTLTSTGYRSYLDSLHALENERVKLQKRTVDLVAPGEQQPEADHALERANSRTGNHLNEFWRDAGSEGFFSYALNTDKQTGLSLMVRYWGAEWGNHRFHIYIDDRKLVTENNTGRWNRSEFFTVTYPIPDDMLAGKQQVRVRFEALPGSTAGPVYQVRLVKQEKER